jgi:hypothetical protein
MHGATIKIKKIGGFNHTRWLVRPFCASIQGDQPRNILFDDLSIKATPIYEHQLILNNQLPWTHLNGLTTCSSSVLELSSGIVSGKIVSLGEDNQLPCNRQFMPLNIFKHCCTAT